MAFGINAGSDVVGYSFTADFDTPHAFIYQNGQMTDLNSLGLDLDGWTLVEARDINDLGDIVGVAYRADVGTRGFLLAAVPEPTTYAMLLGLATLGVVAYRRLRRRA